MKKKIFNLPIYFYNTLTRKKELFRPLEKGRVKIYTCGPTVYNYAHLGNLRAYVFADLLNNLLREAGYQVWHQINLTDIGHNVADEDTGEDKMELGARRENKSLWELADFYIQAFYEDLKKLNITKEKFIWTKATDYIPAQISMIKVLEGRGYTSQISTGIYFDTKKFPNYPELARLDLTGMQQAKRVKDDQQEKKNKTDFCLWRFKKEKENIGMKWNSPWGFGVPGWHIECSAMSRVVLGQHLDIHTGGIDLIPVHHTNEIAQAECSGEDSQRFVNYWLHVNFLNERTGKMSKSKNNFLCLGSLEGENESGQNINPLAYRYLLLMTHYRKELKFSWDSLLAAERAYQKLLKKLETINSEIRVRSQENLNLDSLDNFNHISAEAENYLEKFVLAIHDDLNTAKALAILWAALGEKNITSAEKHLLSKKFDKYLGLKL